MEQHLLENGLKTVSDYCLGYSKHVQAGQCGCIYDFYIAGISVFCCYWRDQARDGQLALDFLCPPISNRLGILHGFADIPDRQQNVMTVL